MTEHISEVTVIGHSIDAASGILIFSLGLFVATRQPWRRLNVVFSFFAILWGLSYFFGNLIAVLDIFENQRYLIIGLLRLAAALVLTYLAVLFPTPFGSLMRRVVPFGIIVPAIGVAFLSDWQQMSSSYIMWNALLAFVLLAVALLCAIRYRLESRASRTRMLCVLAGTALVLDPAMRAGIGHRILLFAVVFVAITWLWASMRSFEGEGNAARNIALISLSVALIGMLIALWHPDPGNSGALGVTRTTAVAILAYGILKHQLFDIDLKIKWTLHRGTVAAFFLAVFFVVSTVAQEFLSDTLGWALGGVVAGLLLFAIMPLYRFAERFSDKAMPGVRNTEEYRTVRKREVYRAALEEALSDGVLSEKDKNVLATLADQLGLSNKEVRVIERGLTVTQEVPS